MTVVEPMTFSEFVEYGRNRKGANIVNGIPWSFDFEGCLVTHENNELYILTDNVTRVTMYISPKVMIGYKPNYGAYFSTGKEINVKSDICQSCGGLNCIC